MVSANEVESPASALRLSCRLCCALDEETDLADELLGIDIDGAMGDVVVLSDYAPLVPGHLLIVSRGHHKSVGSLGSRQRIESVTTVLNGIRERYESSGLYVIAFEHGPYRYGEAGSCIDHAHVHVVPCAKEVSLNDVFFSPVLRSVGLIDWRRLDEIDSLRLLASHVSYLWIQDTARESVVTVVGAMDFVPSQTLRRWCAELLGLRSWDWRSELSQSSRGTTQSEPSQVRIPTRLGRE